MRLDLNLIAATTAVVVGFSAYWSNPNRPINRVFLSLSVHAALWLLAVRAAGSSDDVIFWLRAATAIGAFMPFHLWLIKETLVNDGESLVTKFARGWRWLLLCSVLAGTVLSELYIPGYSTRDNPVFGVGYHAYLAATVAVYLWLFKQTLLESRARSGARRLELQLLLLGGCAAGACILLLMAARTVWGPSFVARLRPQAIIVLVFYLVTVVAITTHRVFDARQILLVAFRKSVLAVIVSLVAFAAFQLFETFVPDVLAFLTTTIVALWVASAVSGYLDRLLQFYPEANVARQAAFVAAQREGRVENLERAFHAVLKGWGQSDTTQILTGNKESLNGGGIVLPGDGAIVQALRQLTWATPERLSRERSSPDREALSGYLSEHKLGVMVITDGPSLSLAVGVGLATSRRPVTYPQVTQLAELASIMESALERAHFSAKVQHTEQLATVGLLGASLAHEIRNPLVSIKTFVQLLPTHHGDPRFREKFFRLIGDEVGRIDQLTQQLLDLASPRTYTAEMIALHPLLQSSIELVAAKAAHRNIQLLTEFQAEPDRAFTDASAAKQVMLNLCFNAIQAVESKETEDRWVKVATRNTNRGLEMVVADNGPGISPEIRPKLFQPFNTTKSTGFGLGLAICSDILANLNASISVDPPEPGHGATFRVIFPCQPSSS